MKIEDIERRIKAIPVKSKAAQLRPLLPLIDTRISEGVKQRDILEALHECGIGVTLKTLQTYLHRYRLAQRQENPKPAKPASESNQAKPAASPAPAPREPAGADSEPKAQESAPKFGEKGSVFERLTTDKDDIDRYMRSRRPFKPKRGV